MVSPLNGTLEFWDRCPLPRRLVKFDKTGTPDENTLMFVLAGCILN
jgi:hypothetical protein